MKHLTNSILIQELKQAVIEERKITAQILEYLREVEHRKLFIEMGYPSLFEFCRRELNYSEGSAQRRISAMRLLKEVPQVEEKIISGELSLSVVSQAQTFFKKQEKKNDAYTVEEKLNLLSQLENTSARECERTLLTLDPELLRQDNERPISEDLTEIRITVDKEFSGKLEKLKNLLSHSHPEISTKEILSLAIDQLLAKKDLSMQITKSPPTSAVKQKSQTRYIPQAIRRAVWVKSKGRCCYRDPKTGRVCEARRFLEIDHITPYSQGGLNIVDNLQLLCSAHNGWKGARLLSVTES